MSVLQDIGAQDVPQWLIFNKIDALAPENQPQMLHDLYVHDGQAFNRMFLSAGTGFNLDGLRQRILQQAQAHADSLLTLQSAHVT
jgi:GTP-binding protein HflX